eukprot:7052356-Pyramimonas_sp.AAC.1
MGGLPCSPGWSASLSGWPPSLSCAVSFTCCVGGVSSTFRAACSTFVGGLLCFPGWSPSLVGWPALLLWAVSFACWVVPLTSLAASYTFWVVSCACSVVCCTCLVVSFTFLGGCPYFAGGLLDSS